MAINDKFANLAVINATVTGGAGIEFVELATGIGLSQGMGIAIDAIEYHIARNLIADFDADEEYIAMALVTSNTVASLGIEVKQVIDKFELGAYYLGAAASGNFVKTPQEIHDFFPPLIVAAPRLYLATQAVAGLEGTAKVRIRFRYVKLSTQEYLEIAESFVLVG